MKYLTELQDEYGTGHFHIKLDGKLKPLEMLNYNTVVGFDTWEDLLEFSETYEGTAVQLKKRDGQEWKWQGQAFSAINGFAHIEQDIGDDWNIEDGSSITALLKDKMDYLLKNVEDVIEGYELKDLSDIVENCKEVFEELADLDEGEILVRDGCAFRTVEAKAMYLTEGVSSWQIGFEVMVEEVDDAE